MSEEIKPKKERKFLKALGKIGEVLIQELFFRVGSNFIRKIGGKKPLPSILFILFSLSLFAQYPNTGNKQRLGFQTTGDGLTWRGSISDTASIQPINNQNAWVILDTVNLKFYSFDFTSNVWNLVGGSAFTQPVDSLFFNVNVPTNNVDTAKMRWDSDLATVVLGLNDNVPNELGFKNFWLVKNQTGSTITKGSLVYANGTVGASGRITVAKFIANGSIDAKYLLGITAHDLSNGEDGYVISFGKIRQVNTDTFAAGAILYPSPTVAGVWTDVEPIAPNIDMPIGFCINSSSNNGTIAIRVASGYKLSELHDVSITFPVENSSLYYKGGLWRDTTAALLVSDTASMLTPYLRKADTASISNRINLKLNISDTLNMLVPYLRRADTTNMLSPYFRDADTSLLNLTSRFASKLNLSDTLNMLVPYLRRADTTNMLSPYFRDADTSLLNLTSRFASKLNLSDTSNMLMPYLRKADTTNMLSPYFRDADTSLLNLTSRFAAKLNISDTLNMLVPYLRKADTTNMLSPYFRDADTSLLNLTSRFASKLNLSDTLNMLVPYLRRADTTNMLSPYFRDADTSLLNLTSRFASKLNLSDTSNMLMPYLRKADTTNMLSPYFRDADTSLLNLTSRFAAKLNISDTLNMLVPYLRKADTTNMLSPYFRDADTVTLSNRINLKLNIADTSDFARDNQISGTSGQVAYFNSSNSVISDAGLIYNATNKLLGINTTTTSGANLIIKNSQEPSRSTFLAQQTFGADTTNWTRGAGWTFNGTLAVATASTGNLTYTTLPDTIISGRAYEITYTQSGYSSGTATIALGNVTLAIPQYNMTANIILLLPTSATGGFRITTSTYTGNLDNISIVEISNQSPILFAGQDDGSTTLYSSLRMPNSTTFAFGGGVSYTTGNNNVANGSNALQSNTTGSSNVANGANALQSNTTGNSNVANGSNALLSNTTGSSNVANGVNALRFNTRGASNVANGVNALQFNTGGFNNVANGGNALQSNTTGSDNVANGLNALRSNTTGNNNIANGSNAMYNTTVGDTLTGSNNIAIGFNAADNIRFAASGNVAIGNAVDLPVQNGSNQGVYQNVLFFTGASGTGTTIAAASKAGIKTNAPNRDLEVAGEVRITDLTTDAPTRLVGADADGDLGQVTLGAGLSLASSSLLADTNFLVTRFDTASMLTPYFRDADTSLLNLTSRLATKLNISDTSAMLANYNSRINLKVNISDTAAMLIPYLRKLDTVSLSNRINLKVNISDTSNMLVPYLRKADTTNMLLPYFRDADTTTLNLTSRFASKLNISDTAAMLSNYNTRINSKLNISDTLSMLTPYFRDADTSLLNLTSRFALKFNTADTSQLNLTSRFATKQNTLSGTGFVKASGTNISFDNSSYLRTGLADSTYLKLTGGTLTGGLTGTTGTFISNNLPQLSLGISGITEETRLAFVTGNIERFKIFSTNSQSSITFQSPAQESAARGYRFISSWNADSHLGLVQDPRGNVGIKSDATGNDVHPNTLYVNGTLGVTGATTLSAPLTVNSSAVFNEGSAIADFRVESDGNANMLFVDGTNNRVGIGYASPTKTLDVNGEVRINTLTATPTSLLGKDGSNVVGTVTTVAQTGLFGRGSVTNASTDANGIITVAHGFGFTPIMAFANLPGSTTNIVNVKEVDGTNIVFVVRDGATNSVLNTQTVNKIEFFAIK